MTSVWGLARAQSVALLGMDAVPVAIEAWMGSGLPRTCLVGLPDAALTQAKERVRAAILSSGYPWPPQVLTINLLPATLPKTGSHYDLSIAASVLAAQGIVDRSSVEGIMLFGELGLDGKVHTARGLFPALLGAMRLGITRALVPADQLTEAGLVCDMEVFGAGTLIDVVSILHGGPGVAPRPTTIGEHNGLGPDLADVAGLRQAKWAMEVAAAGRHHLYLHGPPGVGKTMLASCMPTILPDLTGDEAVEVAAIHSLVGASVERLPTRPPFSAPHHTASLASLVGGGARIALPGAVSLAHRGVLFLDEAPEFSARALETLRVPLESGHITLGRSEASVRYPARFQLVLAANPCPCGLAASDRARCTCAPMAVRRYAARISAPIVDRIDIQAPIHASRRSLSQATTEEKSRAVADRVLAARERQTKRLGNTPWRTNAEVSGPYLRTLPVPEGIGLVESALMSGSLSPRGADKVLKVAWTIADLEGDARPSADQLRAALAMRQGEEIV